MADNNDVTSTIPTMLTTTQLAGMRIDLSIKCGKPISILKNTTLNEKFNVMSDLSLGNKESSEFKLHYFGLGNAGSYSDGMNQDYSPKLVARQHQPTDCALYNQIPLVARQLGNDLTGTTRDKYRLRVLEEINGITYIFYYLKMINFDNWDILTKLREGTDEGEDFYFEKSNLFPTPIELKTEGSIPLSNEYVDTYSNLNFSLTAEELEEVKNACRIKYGSSDRASISEVCTVYGIDTTNNGVNGVQTVPYKEVMSATIFTILTEASPRMANNNNELKLYNKIGSSRPMLLASNEE